MGRTRPVLPRALDGRGSAQAAAGALGLPGARRAGLCTLAAAVRTPLSLARLRAGRAPALQDLVGHQLIAHALWDVVLARLRARPRQGLRRARVLPHHVRPHAPEDQAAPARHHRAPSLPARPLAGCPAAECVGVAGVHGLCHSVKANVQENMSTCVFPGAPRRPRARKRGTRARMRRPRLRGRLDDARHLWSDELLGMPRAPRSARWPPRTPPRRST